ncbi:hypothetical protein [Vibrio gallaecicus]|uniref:hypothetical protein n=1 Tax=Vibrio gallaecicus TaxID=552386 RepID=UPI0025B4C2C0|nr:hypothetical protein [Vibrio gallaecicus]MDN3614399.1 hypothetical protein [Vibrio gallaecicus]
MKVAYNRKEKAPFPLREPGLVGHQILCGDHREMNIFSSDRVHIYRQNDKR